MLNVTRLQEFVAHMWKVGGPTRSPHDFIALADTALVAGDKPLAAFFINLAHEGFDRALASDCQSEYAPSSPIGLSGKK